MYRHQQAEQIPVAVFPWHQPFYGEPILPSQIFQENKPLYSVVFLINPFTMRKRLNMPSNYLRSFRFAIGLTLTLLVTLAVENHIVGRRLVAGEQGSQNSNGSQGKNALPTDYPQTERPVPAFSLIDQHGKPFSEQNFKGQVTFLTFAYSHCTTVCPILVHNVLEAQKRLRAAGGLNAEVRAVFITIDPWRDTPGTLLKRVKSWGMTERSYLLSGKISNVENILKEFNVPAKRDLKTGEIGHPSLVMVIDKRGRIAYSFLSPSVDWLMTASERASP